MSFQAYLDTIRQTTGLGPDDFVALARRKGLAGPGVKAGDVVAWLNTEYGLGRGHAMAIYSVLKSATGQARSGADKREAMFSGSRAHWRPALGALLEKLEQIAPDIRTQTTSGYVSLLRGTAKFAIVAVTGSRMDIGIKLKSAAPTPRFEAAGAWNTMVTHRVRIADPEQIDAEVIDWLSRAYVAAA
jgi:Domain of unknown function (DUF4287)/Domain of unknown function (DUF5655)